MKEEYLEANLTPLQLTQRNTVKLLFKAMELDYEGKRQGYVSTVRHLVSLLWKYMPDKMRDEIKGLYDQNKKNLSKYDNVNLTSEQKEAKKIGIEYTLAKNIMDLCIKTLVNSPIVEESIEVDIHSDIDRDELKKMISRSDISNIMEE